MFEFRGFWGSQELRSAVLVPGGNVSKWPRGAMWLCSGIFLKKKKRSACRAGSKAQRRGSERETERKRRSSDSAGRRKDSKFRQSWVPGWLSKWLSGWLSGREWEREREGLGIRRREVRMSVCIRTEAITSSHTEWIQASRRKQTGTAHMPQAAAALVTAPTLQKRSAALGVGRVEWAETIKSLRSGETLR